MNYKLNFLKIGSGLEVKQIDISNEFNILDFRVCEDDLLYFITNKNLGIINNQKATYPLFDSDFDDLTSFDYNRKSKYGILVDKFGSEIFKFSYNNYNKNNVISTFDSNRDVLEKFYLKIKKSPVSNEFIKTTECSLTKYGEIYFLVPDMHRGFKIESGKIIDWIGNGKGGYSVCSSCMDSSFLNPQGIYSAEDNVFYILDSGNKCIRKVNKKTVELITEDIDYLKKERKNENNKSIKKIRFGYDLFFYLDGKEIKYYSNLNKKIGVIYFGENIISFDIDQNRNIIVLSY